MPSAYSTSLDRPLSRDALDNRERILGAARSAFAELGIDASVEEIACRADVGIGTLYRRFPTKDVLIDAVFDEHLDRIIALAREACAAANAWTGLLDYVTQVVELQADDRGLSELLSARTEKLAAIGRARLRPLVRRLIVRARPRDVGASTLPPRR